MKKFEKFDKYTDEKLAKFLDRSKGKSKSSAPSASASSNPYAASTSSQGSNPYAASSTSQNSNPYASATPPQSSNPYATPQTNDPYIQSSNPYQNAPGYGGSLGPQQPQSNVRSASPQPPAYSGSGRGYGSSDNDRYGSQSSATNNGGYGAPAPYSSDPYRNEKSPAPSGGYGSNRYNNSGSYGTASGYGSDPWGGESSSAAPTPRGPGGYGGLGSQATSDMADDADRNALFAGAKRRQQPSSQNDASTAKAAGSYGTSSGYGGYGGNSSLADDPDRAALFGGAKDRAQRDQKSGGQSGLPPDNGQPGGGYDMTDGYMAGSGYGSYQDRQLTAEEQEEEDVNATKDEIRRIKQQDVSSTRNALRVAQQAEQTGRETLERLGLQGEMIHNTEKNLDLASNQNRLAQDKAKELKHLNRSMFAVKVNNPFTKTRRQMEMDDEVMDRHHMEKQQREETRRATYESQMRRADASKELRGPSGMVVKKGNLAERSKYQFEADSEDEAMEDEIDSNLDAISRGVGTLNVLGRAMNKEVDTQNERLGVIAGKADRVDDEIHMNRARLDRIK